MHESNPYTTLNDKPISDTALIKHFYGNFANRVINEIEGCEAPKTIAITGGWGSGKTSVLANIYNTLTENLPPFEEGSQSRKRKPNYIGVWFEAWRYEQEAQPIIALLHAIKDEFSLFASLKESIKKTFDVTFFGSLSTFDSVAKMLSGGIDPKFSNLPKVAKQYEQDNLLTQLPTNQIHHAIKAAVDVAIKKAHNQKLLIFIDDLDRCNPKAALRLLEGIKLYLNIPNCVIVMAVDQEQLECAVKEEVDKSGHHFLGVEYLEKLCQDAHRLPAIPTHISTKFVVNEVTKVLKSDDDDIEKEIEDAIEIIKSQLSEFACLPANPRRIKMVINRLVAHLADWKEITQVPDSSSTTSVSYIEVSLSQQVEALLFIVCTQVSYRAIFEQISWDTSFIERIVDAFRDNNFSEESLKGTALEGIYIPDESTPLKGIHPSHLTVFRPATIIQAVEIEPFKALLKTLIDRYNGFSNE